jgi:toxin ParE1/3/4
VAQVVWTDRALADLEAIRTYIGQFSPLASQRFALRLIRAGEALAEQSDRGRGLVGGRRELTVVPPYLIRYRLRADVVEILTVRHGARAPQP